MSNYLLDMKGASLWLDTLHPDRTMDSIQHKVVEAGTQANLDTWAEYAQHRVGVYDIEPPDPVEITDQNWQQLIDPAQPTIAIRAGDSLYDAPLLAVASQRLRARGEPSCNIVMLPRLVYGSEHASRRQYRVGRGIMLDQYGTVYKGDFPELLRVDATNGEQAPRYTERRNLQYINTPEQQALLQNKAAVHARLGAAGIAHPQVLDTWQPDGGPAPERLLGVLQQHGRIVVKPEDGSLGTAVLLRDAEHTDPEEFLRELQTTYALRDKVLLEEWVESLPLHHGGGARLDWNIRMLIAGGRNVAAYARVGPYGAPVNIAQDALPERLTDTLEDCGLGGTEQRAVLTQLDALATDIYAAIPANFMGADVMVQPDLAMPIIEVNDERAGGLDKVWLYDKDDRFATSEAVVRHWRASMFPDFKPSRRSGRLQPLHPERSEVLQELYTLAVGDEEMARFAARALNSLLISPTSDRQLRVQIRDIHRALQEGALTELQGYAPRIIKQLGVEALRELDGDSACGLFMAGIRQEPTNLMLREQLAQVLMPEYPGQEMCDIFQATFAGADTAWAHGYALVSQARLNTGNPLAVELSTYMQIERQTAQYLLRQPGERQGLARELAPMLAALTPEQLRQTEPLVHNLVLMDDLARGDFEDATTHILDVPDPGERDYMTLMQLLYESMLDSPQAQLALGVLDSQSGVFTRALAIQKTLDAPQAARLRGMLTANFAGHLQEAGLHMDLAQLEQVVARYDAVDEVLPADTTDPAAQLLRHVCNLAAAFNRNDTEAALSQLKQVYAVQQALPGEPFSICLGVIESNLPV